MALSTGTGLALAGGAGLLGGFMGTQSKNAGANNAANAATQGAQIQADQLNRMFDKTMEINKPYNLAGLVGLQQLLGNNYGSMVTNPNISHDVGSNLISRLARPDTTGIMVDGQLVKPNASADRTAHSAGGGYTAGGGVDPTGGAGKYANLLENLSTGGLPQTPNMPQLNLKDFNYQFSENDPGYQFRKEQMEKTINEQAAARGNYNSRAALNTLSEGSRALTADEVDRQFGRQKDIYGLGMTKDLSQYGADTSRLKDIFGMDYRRSTDTYNRDYGKLSDLFNMSNRLGGQRYGAAIDLTKIGQNSAATAGNAAMATGQGLSSTYGQLSQALQNSAYAKGGAQSDFWAGAGAMPMNMMLMNKLYGGA